MHRGRPSQTTAESPILSLKQCVSLQVVEHCSAGGDVLSVSRGRHGRIDCALRLAGLGFRRRLRYPSQLEKGEMLNNTGSCNGPPRSGSYGWTAVIAWGAVAVVIGVGCGPEDDGITYRRSVRPILQDRCTICHYSGGPIPGDIENPFARTTGLVDSLNTWAAEPSYAGLTPIRNVLPGDPDNSFLLDKVSDPALGLVPERGGGSYMPLNYPLLATDQIAAIEKWVTDGAQNDDFYVNEVKPIFGEGTLGRPGSCSFCHYEGTPNPPNLIDPFDPVDGVIGIRASYRTDLERVKPGFPDESFLVLKIRATQGSGDIGATMPYAYPALSSDQIDIVSQWIREGALNN